MNLYAARAFISVGSTPSLSATQSGLQRNSAILSLKMRDICPFFAIIPQQTGLRRTRKPSAAVCFSEDNASCYNPGLLQAEARPSRVVTCLFQGAGAEFKAAWAVWKIDRFGRSLKHLVNSLAELTSFGVAFISLRDNIDLSTPSGRLMFQIIGAMAEFERALIQERVRAGLRNARAKGRRLGKPRVIVDSFKIASLRSQGCSWGRITGGTGTL